MIRLLVLLIALYGLISCSSTQMSVHSDIDPDYDLWTYKTFNWGRKIDIEAGRNPLYYNELNDKRIKAAVNQELTARGYSFTESDPELIVHYHIIVDDRSVVRTEPYGYNYGPYWTTMKSNIYAYHEGTLIIDLMDKKSNNLIWRGWAVSVIDEVEEVDDLIKIAVGKIFKKFPKNKK
ncbi:MAG TPA: DUF4136 domain-containing protein [Cyclobacteriaceae bacterium]|nr:DUF4136 domain-containing protein [Cyclobacteriaceae bacterium]